MERQKYIISFQVYVQGDQVVSNCSDITFINTGSTNAQINNQFVLLPNQSISISCQFNEIDVTQYRITFPSGVIANNSVTVIKKSFV